MNTTDPCLIGCSTSPSRTIPSPPQDEGLVLPRVGMQGSIAIRLYLKEVHHEVRGAILFGDPGDAPGPLS